MPGAPLFTSWLVQCRSPEAARALQQRLATLVSLDTLVEDAIRIYEAGNEKRQVKRHRLGDYFADIWLLPDQRNGPSAFRVVFQRLPDAGRFWKDLMVNIIQDVQASPETVTITPDYKGDKKPLQAVENTQ